MWTKMASHRTNIYRQKRIGRFFNLKTIIQLLAVLSLVAAYFIGFSLREKNELVNLQKHYPKGTSFKKVSTNPLLFEVVHSSKNTNHPTASNNGCCLAELS